MSTIIERLHVAIYSAKRENIRFKQEVLIVLIPLREHGVYLHNLHKELRADTFYAFNFMRGAGAEKPSIETVVLMGVTCHLIPADVPTEFIYAAQAIKAQAFAESDIK